MLALLSLSAALAEAPSEGTVPLRFTALDLPYNATGGTYRPLSMQTSMDLGFAGTRLGTLGVREAFGKFHSKGLELGLGLPALLVANVVVFNYVGGWMHEEWHRAAMAAYDVESHNTIYDPSNWSQAVISVDQVSDQELSRLKETAPAATARMSSAGVESQLVLARNLGDAAFFEGGGRRWGPLYLSGSWLALTMAFQEINVLGYHSACASGLDQLTDEMNRQELTVPERDFTGADCIGWAYDLHRPGEPYAARGRHPYGEGIDRYRSGSDLTEEERAFLRTNARLTLLNAVDPHLFYVDGFFLPGGARVRERRWVASLGHTPNPFGYTLTARGGLLLDGTALQTELAAHVRGSAVTPGLEVTMRDQELPHGLSLTAGLGAWLQPEDLRLDAAHNRPGGRILAQVGWSMRPGLALFLGGEGKTAGWVPGNAYLGPNASVRSGIVATLP